MKSFIVLLCIVLTILLALHTPRTRGYDREEEEEEEVMDGEFDLPAQPLQQAEVVEDVETPSQPETAAPHATPQPVDKRQQQHKAPKTSQESVAATEKDTVPVR